MGGEVKRWKVAVATDPQWGYGRDAVDGCVRYLEEHDSCLDPVLLCQGFENPDRLSQRFDAFLLSGRSPWIRPYIKNQPVVHLDVTAPQPGEITVSTDSEAIGKLAADILWKRGLDHFGFCTYAGEPGTDTEHRSRARLSGFKHGLKEHGLGDVAEQVSIHPLGSMHALLGWLESLPRPFGVFAFNDSAALEVLQACAVLDLQVPHEASVLGVDNDQLICHLIQPSLTSIDINLPELAYQGLATLERMLEGQAEITPHRLIPVEDAVRRESTGHFSTTADSRLARALRVIRENARKAVSVGDIVRASGLSRRNLETLFQQELGRTPLEELAMARHRECLKALRTSDASLEQICSAFELTPSRFFRNFKKLEGCTPAEYRNYYRGDSSPVRSVPSQSIKRIDIALVSSLQWQSARDFLAGATAYAQTDPEVHLVMHDAERLGESVVHSQYDGILVLAGDQVPAGLGADVPVLFLEYEQNATGGGRMQIDERDIGLLAARHFLRKGHLNFAYCSYEDVKPVTPRQRELGLSDRRSLDRLAGYREGLDEAGLHGTQIHAYSLNATEGPLLDWLMALPKPTALFCFNDQIAIQIEMMCHNHGLRVPEDIAILGVDNSEGYCRLAQPTLSSIDVGFDRVGMHALKQFVTRIRGEAPNEDQIFPAQMVRARGSTAGLAVDDAALCRAVDYIEQNKSKALTVEDVASAANLGRRILEKRFKLHLRTTPHRYLLEARLMHAEALLIYSSLRINEISDRCGFTQTNHFCRVFREHHGCTPRAFRTQRGAMNRHLESG